MKKNKEKIRNCFFKRTKTQNEKKSKDERKREKK